MRATYEQLDSLGPEELFIIFQLPRGTLWVLLIHWMMLIWGIESVFGKWN